MIYSVSTGCYSDYDETVLSNEKVFSKEEFKEICIECLKKVITVDNYIYTEEEVTKLLIQDYGFKKVEYLNCHLFDYSSGNELPRIYAKGKE